MRTPPHFLQVTIDRDLARALKRYAAESERSLAGITRIALRRTIPRRFFEAEEQDQPDTAA